MCNLKHLKSKLSAIELAAKRQLGLPLIWAGSDETSNMKVPETSYPRTDGLFLRAVDPDAPEDGIEAICGHWNLTPHFHKKTLKEWRASTNNARSEGMADAPSFKHALRHKRCIVPATSFVEWTGPKGTKTKHHFTRSDGGMLFMAGLWDRPVTPDLGPVDTYTLVMMEAGPGDDVGPFHNRQPVQLDADSARTWLDLGGDWRSVIKPPPAGTLVADPPEPIAA